MPRTPIDVMRGLLVRFFPEPTFRPWILCAAAIFGLTYGLSDEDQRFIAECMGLDASTLPQDAATRVALVVGRRGGKSRFAAFLGVFAACFRDYTDILAPGEKGVVMIVAPDRRQARVIFGYVKALITQTPMLAAMLAEPPKKESLELDNGISIEVATASFKSVRGFSVVCGIVDECAFLPTDDSSEPDSELIAALARDGDGPRRAAHFDFESVRSARVAL